MRLRGPHSYSPSTVHSAWEKMAYIKTVEQEKTNFTAALGCMENSTKLNPMLIKRKTWQSCEATTTMVNDRENKDSDKDDIMYKWQRQDDVYHVDASSPTTPTISTMILMASSPKICRLALHFRRSLSGPPIGPF